MVRGRVEGLEPLDAFFNEANDLTRESIWFAYFMENLEVILMWVEEPDYPALLEGIFEGVLNMLATDQGVDAWQDLDSSTVLDVSEAAVAGLNHAMGVVQDWVGDVKKDFDKALSYFEEEGGAI